MSATPTSHLPEPKVRPSFLVGAFGDFDVRCGSNATDVAGLAYQLMSASLRERPKCCIVAKRRDGPQTDIADLTLSLLI